MKVMVIEKENYCIINVSGSMTTGELKPVKEKLEDVVQNSNKHVFLDFENVTFICSSALSMIFMFMGKIKQQNREFMICNLNSSIYKLFVVTGVDKHLSIADSIECAEELISR